MAATVAPLDLEGGADEKATGRSLPRSVLVSCALSFALSLLLPAKSGLPGYALGWAVCNLAGLALHRVARSAARLAHRDLAVDAFRGATLFNIVTFHAAWSLNHAGLTSTCTHALPVDWLRMDFMFFLAALICGHAFIIWLGGVNPEGFLLFYPGYSWTLVTTWRHWASKTGMALMMFSAGYSSKLLFDRARHAGALRRYFLRSLRHIALLALVSAGITAASYAKSQKAYSCTGAVHLLLTGAVAQLPFLPFPRLALAVGSAGLLLEALGGQYVKPQGCGGFDHQPFQLGLSMQVAGIGACHLRVLYFMLRKVRYDEVFVTWPGQNSLLVYLSHQCFLLPLALVLAPLLASIGWKPGVRWCSDYGSLHAQSLSQMMNLTRHILKLNTTVGLNSTLAAQWTAGPMGSHGLG